MGLKSKIQTLLTNPIWQQERTIFFVWTFLGALYGIIKVGIGKYNNYKIFKYVYWHAIEGQPLYAEYPAEYYDVNHYGIIFSAIIAPFALLPDWLGIVFWVALNTVLLFYAIKALPLSHNQKVFIYWFALIELMTAQGVQQFNISVAAFLVLAFALVEKKKDFWAACVIMLGAMVKIYPLAGLAFFFFSKNKGKLVVSCIFWGAIFFILPMLYTTGPEYVLSQYVEWAERLQVKSKLNMFAQSQNISLVGLVRKLSGNPSYSDLWLMIPGLILFFIPYTRLSQYKYLCFRMMFLASVMLFLVLFSSGSEGGGYVIAMIGVALWYLCSPSPHKKYNFYLLIFTLVMVAVSSTELVPPFIRKNFIVPYVFKAWSCIVVWFTICYEMIFLDFKESDTRLRNSIVEFPRKTK